MAGLLEQIPVLTEEDFKDEEVLQIEDLVKIHSSFHLENPLTYFVFISKRPDLTNEEKLYYLEVAQRLQNNEALRYKHAIKKMHEPIFLEETKTEETP